MTREKAIEWITATHEAVKNLAISRQIFWQLQGVVGDNERLWNSTSPFLHWINSIFGDSVVLGVRRQLDRDDRAISLHRLLDRLKQHPNVLDGVISPDEIQRDIDELLSNAARVQNYADRSVAHADRRGVGADHPTFRDLNDAIDCLIGLVNKYARLIRQGELPDLPPAESHSWKEIFTFQWIEPDA